MRKRFFTGISIVAIGSPVAFAEQVPVLPFVQPMELEVRGAPLESEVTTLAPLPTLEGLPIGQLLDLRNSRCGT
jgi:hypothetical protein